LSGEAVLSVEKSGKPLGDLAESRWISAPPEHLAGGRGLAAPSPRTQLPLSAFGLDFRPLGPRFASLPNSLHPPMLRGLVKH